MELFYHFQSFLDSHWNIEGIRDENKISAKDYRELLGCTDDSIPNNRKAIEFIENPHYFGEYYCYHFSLTQILSNTSAGKYQPQVNSIRESKLNIEKPNEYSDEVIVTLEEITSESGNKFLFRGHAYRLININQIFIPLSEVDNKSFRWLLFDDIVLRKRDLYFKEIAMLSHTFSAKTKPIFTKMILTKKRLDIEDPKIIQTLRGTLTFNTNEILIDSGAANIVCNDYPEIAEIFNPKYATQIYRINQSSIIENINLKWDYDKKQKCLLRLMELSMNSVQACVDQPEDEHAFWKRLQNNSIIDC